MFIEHKTIDDESITEVTEKKLFDLVEEYKTFDSRINFEELWRYCAPLPEGTVTDEEKKVTVDPTTKLVKFSKALKCRLPKILSLEDQDKFINKIVNAIQTSWGLTK